MTIEFNALMTNEKWDLVPTQPHFNIIGNKWIFHIKCNVDGSIFYYKAWLVTKGYNQRHSTDYSETFNLVIKHQTTKFVLTITFSHG